MNCASPGPSGSVLPNSWLITGLRSAVSGICVSATFTSSSPAAAASSRRRRRRVRAAARIRTARPTKPASRAPREYDATSEPFRRPNATAATAFPHRDRAASTAHAASGSATASSPTTAFGFEPMPL